MNPLGCEIFVNVEELEENKPSIDFQYFSGENRLNVLNPQNEKADLMVFGVDGRLYQKEKINAIEQTFQLPHDLNGIYFIQILTEQGERFGRKLVLYGR